MEPDALYADFGRLVRAHRQRLKLRQDQLAELIGLSRTSVTNIEHGRQKVLLHQIFQLAEALKVSPEVLLPASGTPRVSPEIEQKLDKHVPATARDWARRIVGPGTKGATPHGASKD